MHCRERCVTYPQDKSGENRVDKCVLTCKDRGNKKMKNAGSERYPSVFRGLEGVYQQTLTPCNMLIVNKKSHFSTEKARVKKQKK